MLLPALIAGLLVTATQAPLGIQVLKRGIVFIDIAIAQIAGVGVIVADFFGWEAQGMAVQVSALSAALLGALFLTWTEKRWPDIQEAIIGTVFVLAATLSVLLLASNPHGGEYLKDLLVGQILWVGHTPARSGGRALLPSCWRPGSASAGSASDASVSICCSDCRSRHRCRWSGSIWCSPA